MRRWDETVEVLKKRDENIDQTNQKLHEKLELVKNKEAEIKTLAADLESTAQQNTKLDADLQSKTRELAFHPSQQTRYSSG